MNREEAKFILGAYRPTSEDAHDPQFREALDLARSDPVLARWFAEEQALDLAFSTKVRGGTVPADLRAQLLLARTTAAGRGFRWRRIRWLAAAACLAAGLTVAALWLKPEHPAGEFAAFRTAMAAAASDMDEHADVWGLDVGGYRTWLAENNGAADFALPATLADKGIAACKIVSWHERKVTMLCLKFGGRHVDVFIVAAADLPGVEIGTTPRFFPDTGLTSAAWRKDGKIYLLAGAMPSAELRQLL